MPNGTEKRPTLIWDLPTRVFHWLLVICFTVAWITHENDRFLYHHVYVGYLFIGLLLFRLFWGIWGTHHARFRSFAHDWPSVYAYLKGLLTGQASRYLGHNPAGSWAIFLMLFLGIVVTISGLLVLGGEEGHGPLQGIVSYEGGAIAKELHEAAASFMLLVVFVHVVGVIAESILHRENLVWSMIVGFKETAASVQGVRLFPLIATAMIAIVFTSAAYYFRGYITQTEDAPFFAFTNEALPQNETWQSECGECHLAFHPSLLPARSWDALFAEQSDHFGDDLALDQDMVDELLVYANANSSEQEKTEAAFKITKSVPADQAPTRITEIRYWKKKHDEIDEKYWKHNKVKSKANCGACHIDAKQAWFEDSNMRLPKLDK